MKSITIKGSQRESVGKVATKALRNAGKVPCVLYGGDKPVHFSADEIAFKDLVYTPNAYTAVIELEDGQKFDAVLQDIQFHPVTDNILHVDFYQLFEDKPITMRIPVRLEGNSPGVRNGGRLLFRKRKLSIRALPALLPDFITVDISKLRIGQTIAVESILNDDYTFLHPDSTAIVQVKASRTSVDEELEDEDEEGVEGAEGEATEGGEAPEAEAAE
ncbi:MAG: 50S ribosomal protein L25/general stress protein Ctc [Allomuricauda sp.]|jgi:large subunit ribosomal protein L25|uniref:50S ribosomal protein L25/general stress protein Ctc n=1 Tax=unclassified Allomuricauda TaxID=2615049 RepID=UPI001B219C5F|nr:MULTISPECIES: 50S ribosomal protein L25/general stress protein Ctc [unclassified Allomuricauda]MBO6531778.1 50S ribosomal protein L25/general stress protein Ctc [Allomuricauda sp.]MBO6588328.1 50S ribosomal protein L25/general stress protein Ctc [Allomuricauda sp.]MBO6617953.1 50S ribosomal protein L25/general stress protein Ctc [Allomuricauda sp.]MBO6643036.1 50S ribosomal protein L25/general stress protein Ctc [Allomuricauda sp.]MBO6746288.1 50S ribosomal protein L25/general stress protei